MNCKRVNQLFLTIMIVYVSVVAILFFGYRHIQSFRVSTEANYVLSEMILVLPALFFVLRSKESFSKVLGFHKIHGSTVGMLFFATALLVPLTTFVNLLTMLYTDNVVLKSSNQVTSMSVFVSMFFIAVFAPICEEMVCRGAFFYGYRKSGNTLQAMFFSALLFGFLHMNLNQMPYTFCLGLFLAMLREITGSLWAPILMHMFFNGISTMFLYVSKWIYAGSLAGVAKEFTANKDYMMAAIGTYAILAVVCTCGAVCTFFWIEEREGKSTFLKDLWYGRHKEYGRVITMPLVVGIIISVLYMVRYI